MSNHASSAAWIAPVVPQLEFADLETTLNRALGKEENRTSYESDKEGSKPILFHALKGFDRFLVPFSIDEEERILTWIILTFPSIGVDKSEEQRDAEISARIEGLTSFVHLLLQTRDVILFDPDFYHFSWRHCVDHTFDIANGGDIIPKHEVLPDGETFVRQLFHKSRNETPFKLGPDGPSKKYFCNDKLFMFAKKMKATGRWENGSYSVLLRVRWRVYEFNLTDWNRTLALESYAETHGLDLSGFVKQEFRESTRNHHTWDGILSPEGENTYDIFETRDQEETDLILNEATGSGGNIEMSLA